MLPFYFALERDPKNIFYYQRDIELYGLGPQFLYHLIEMNTYTLKSAILVCIIMLYTGLYIFFFILQDLMTESILSSRE